MSFGGMLSAYRKGRKISLRRLAEELDMSPAFLSDIENDRRLPPNSDKHFGAIQKIIEVLSLDAKESEALKLEADKALCEKGMISKDAEEYLNNSPNAQLVMRRAIDKNVDDSKWEEILKIL